jgi:hypothetical protein
MTNLNLRRRLKPMKEKLKIWLVLLGIMLPCNLYGSDLQDGNWQLDGFYRNNTGFWTQDFDQANSDDSLATERNWFRLNLNGNPANNLALKAEVLGVWEPEYPREKNSGIQANEYNSFDFRELRLDWNPMSGHTFMFGRQIVNWGEALSGRVGDCINPADGRFDLGFTNLEDSRMPIWMLRGVDNFISLNSTIEWIFSPYMQADRFRVGRNAKTTTVSTNGTYTVGGRFKSYPETRTEALGGLGNMYLYNPNYPYNSGVMPASYVPLPILGPPLNNAYQYMPANAFGLGTPSGYYFLHTPVVKTEYPGSAIEDSRYGAKVATHIGGFQTGAYFWHGNEFYPVIRLDNGVPKTPGTPLNATVIYPSQNVYGIFGNKSTNFGLLRFDCAFRPNRNYNSKDYEKYPKAIAEKDNLMFQLGYDKSFFLQKLNPSQTFDLSLEYIGEFILDPLNDIHVPGYYIPYEKDLHLIQTRVATNYGFGKYEYSVTALYYTTGCSLVMPKFTYKPDWMNNKWEFTLQYNYIWAKDHYTYPLGLKEEEDMVLLTTQFSFP